MQSLTFGTHFLKIVFRACKAFIFAQTFQWALSEVLFDIRISSRKYKSQQKLAKNITHFTTQFRLKKPHSFLTHLTLKIIWSRNTAKKLSDFTNFPANMVPCGAKKNIYTTPFLDAQELHSWSTFKANVCIFLYISLKKIYFRGVVRFYLVGRWDGGRLNRFLKKVRCLDLANFFKIFYFNWNFWKFNYS